MRVGGEIGCPVRVYQDTGLMNKGHYARICVEVDMTKPLLSKCKHQILVGLD